VLASGHTQGDGPFTRRAQGLLDQLLGVTGSILTTSCTSALELASWVLDLGPGDEVIVPSFTFSSTATAIVQTGARPVFVDCDEHTGNADPDAVAAAVGPATRAIYAMHYGGAAHDWDRLLAVAERADLPVVEDNAHGLGAAWDGQPLGTFGAISTQSFHATKNVHCGEGGSIWIKDQIRRERAEIIREKGTDRSRFLRGQVDKYTWVDRGASYLPSDLNAAILTDQLEIFADIQVRRHQIWKRYATELVDWAEAHGAELMTVDPRADHPAHLFFILLPTEQDRNDLLKRLNQNGVGATFHYIPLDSSEAGRRFGRTPEPCSRTASFSARLIRLPLWAGLSENDVSRVIDQVRAFDRTGTTA
jgi:dTDP-4-amino-4,6-dideoxygalactose transaminase